MDEILFETIEMNASALQLNPVMLKQAPLGHNNNYGHINSVVFNKGLGFHLDRKEVAEQRWSY